MKKCSIILLICLLPAFLLSGCGKDPLETTAPSVPSSTIASAAETTSAAETKPTESAPSTVQGHKNVPDGPEGGTWILGQTSFAWKTYYYSGREVARRYYYYIPSSYTIGERLPLVFTLPGTATTAEFQISQGHWTQLAEKEGFILLAPEYVSLHGDRTLSSESLTPAQMKQSNGTCQRWVATGVEPVSAYGVDDVAYLCDLMDVLIDSGHADPSRIYATGLSHGAYMAERLAIDVPERIAGIGVVAGGLWASFANRVLTNRVRIVFIQGTADPVVPYEGIGVSGNYMSLPLEDTINWFLDQYGLSDMISKGTVQELEDKDPSDGCRTTRVSYAGPNGEEQIIEYLIQGGGHTWPGGSQYMAEYAIGKLCRDFQASEVIWNDLKTAVNTGTELSH